MSKAEAKSIPKPNGVTERTLPALYDTDLNRHLTTISAPERLALEALVAEADLIQVEDAPPFLLVQVSAEILDILATVGAEREDMENTLEDEPDEEGEPDQDLEPSIGEHGGVVDGEPQVGCAPPGSVKSLEAFRERKRLARSLKKRRKPKAGGLRLYGRQS